MPGHHHHHQLDHDELDDEQHHHLDVDLDDLRHDHDHLELDHLDDDDRSVLRGRFLLAVESARLLRFRRRPHRRWYLRAESVSRGDHHDHDHPQLDHDHDHDPGVYVPSAVGLSVGHG